MAALRGLIPRAAPRESEEGLSASKGVLSRAKPLGVPGPGAHALPPRGSTASMVAGSAAAALSASYAAAAALPPPYSLGAFSSDGATAEGDVAAKFARMVKRRSARQHGLLVGSSLGGVVGSPLSAANRGGQARQANSQTLKGSAENSEEESGLTKGADGGLQGGARQAGTASTMIEALTAGLGRLTGLSRVAEGLHFQKDMALGSGKYGCASDNTPDATQLPATQFSRIPFLTSPDHRNDHSDIAWLRTASPSDDDVVVGSKDGRAASRSLPRALPSKLSDLGNNCHHHQTDEDNDDGLEGVDTADCSTPTPSPSSAAAVSDWTGPSSVISSVISSPCQGSSNTGDLVVSSSRQQKDIALSIGSVESKKDASSSTTTMITTTERPSRRSKAARSEKQQRKDPRGIPVSPDGRRSRATADDGSNASQQQAAVQPTQTSVAPETSPSSSLAESGYTGETRGRAVSSEKFTSPAAGAPAGESGPAVKSRGIGGSSERIAGVRRQRSSSRRAVEMLDEALISEGANCRRRLRSMSSTAGRRRESRDPKRAERNASATGELNCCSPEELGGVEGAMPAGSGIQRVSAARSLHQAAGGSRGFNRNRLAASGASPQFSGDSELKDEPRQPRKADSPSAAAGCSAHEDASLAAAAATTLSEQGEGHQSTMMKTKNLLIFDWDDTILATHFLAIRHQCALTDPFVPKVVAEAIQQIETRSLQTLALAEDAGVIIVITNASMEWVIRSGEKYAPRVLHWLLERQIKILSARDKFQASGMPQRIWKTFVFSEQIRVFFASHLGKVHQATQKLAKLESLSEKISALWDCRSSIREEAKTESGAVIESYCDARRDVVSNISELNLEKCCVISIGDGEGEREALLEVSRDMGEKLKSLQVRLQRVIKWEADLLIKTDKASPSVEASPCDSTIDFQTPSQPANLQVGDHLVSPTSLESPPSTSASANSPTSPSSKFLEKLISLASGDDQTPTTTHMDHAKPLFDALENVKLSGLHHDWHFKSLKLLPNPAANQLLEQHKVLINSFAQILKAGQSLDLAIQDYGNGLPPPRPQSGFLSSLPHSAKSNALPPTAQSIDGTGRLPEGDEDASALVSAMAAAASG